MNLAFAITIHKTQGKTFEAGIVHCGSRVFGPGQAYVAFSRMTSSNGLHVIDFDPNSSIANTKALLEYNRLRKLYRPDLPQFEIPIKKVSKRKQQFTASNMDESPEIDMPVKKSRKTFIGMVNNDSVSCYCNASLQCLVRVEEFNNTILVYSSTSALVTCVQGLIGDFKNPRRIAPIEGFRLRFALANQTNNCSIFSLPQQQDASEFITELFQQLVTELNSQQVLCNIFGFVLKITHQCSSCNGAYLAGTPEHCYKYPLNFKNNDKKVRFVSSFS